MRYILHCVAVAALVPLAAPAAGPQNYPARPIRVIVPTPPGNTPDIVGRLLAQKLSERLGQPVIVDNRPGASGQLGMELAARAAPDGYTIAIGQAGNLAVTPHAVKKSAYDPLRDFQPVALMGTNFLGLVVHPSVPFRSMKELIAHAKAHPGRLSFGSSGEGSYTHLATEELRVLAGFAYLHVPYKGTTQVATSVMSGQIDAMIGGFTGIAPYVRSGRLRLIAITNDKRIDYLPGVPTIAETVPGYVSQGWYGYVAPAGTPRQVVQFLNQEINRALRLPDIREQTATAGLEIVTDTPEAFGDTIRRDFTKYGKLVRTIDFQPQ